MMDPVEQIIYNHHKELFKTDNLKKLGLIHWYLLYANNKYRQNFEEETKNDNTYSYRFIYWWIFRNLSSIDELQSRVLSLLPKIQLLKEELSKKSHKWFSISYSEMISNLIAFSNKNSETIDGLYQFVTWLLNFSEVSPCILFSYQTWGTTRKSWRLTLGKVGEKPKDKEIERMIETVLGFRLREGYTWKQIMVLEAFERFEPELGASVEMEDVENEAAYRSFDKFLGYIIEIRDAMRTIIGEIESIYSGEILKSQQFLVEFIQKIRSLPHQEHQLWDFKQTIEAWHLRRGKESIRNQKEYDFACKVAGFANSKGGIMIIGISDENWEIVGLDEIENKTKFTREILEKRCGEVWDHLEIISLPLEKSSGKIANCLILLIPQTKRTIQVEFKQGQYSYPYRKEQHTFKKVHKIIDERKKNIGDDNFYFTKEIVYFIYHGLNSSKIVS